MIDTFKAYFQKHFSVDSLFDPKSDRNTSPLPPKFKLSGAKKLFLHILRISPWLCGGGFILSFFPYFQTPYAYSISFFGQYLAIDFTGILKFICVSGLIGFGTNWLAIKMLFKPVGRRPIWGQGLIPAQKDRIIQSLAQGMYNHVLNQNLIRKRVEETGLVKRVNDLAMNGTISLLGDGELRESIKKTLYDSMESYAGREDVRAEIRGMIDSRLEQNLDKGLKKFLLQTYKRYNKEEYEEVIDKIVADIPELALQLMEKLETQLERAAAFIRKEKKQSAERIMEIFIDLLNRIDIADLLAKQMAHFNEAKLERMIRESTDEQLQYIQYLGTILGMLGGLLIWQPVIMVSVYIAGFVLLYLLDILLLRLSANPSQA